MSYNNTQLSCELPIFKDKVMYINPTNSAYKIEQSYVISASYNGILRLSPNSYNTIYETNPIEFTVEQDSALSSSYSDAIVFDDNAIIEEGEETEAKKLNADIRYRMISGSDSDGYLVNFRMSDESVEFDNLGVIGITKTSKLTIYSDAQFSDQQAFILGNTVMPSLPNTNYGNRSSITAACNALSGLSSTPANIKSKKTPEAWDEIKIDIVGEGDKSYLLSGYQGSDGKRMFKYSKSHQFIKDIIMETLLSVQSVPTGSVHWLPVTLAQYKALIAKNQYPNHYFRKNISEKIDTDEPTDPIVRDYLICDGRKYYTKDFPELAKILWKEKITYWDKNGNMCEEINGEPKEETVDGKTEITYPNYFRVPDLRTKFISYVYAKSALDALYVEPENLQEYKTEEHNIVGTYTPDNSPKYLKNQKKSSHFHFSAYGSYNAYNYKGESSDNMYEFHWYDTTDDLSNISTVRLWYLSNTTGDLRWGNSKGDDGNSDPGWGYGFGAAGPRRRSCSTVDHIVVNAFASAPGGGHANHIAEPSLGKSSVSKTIYYIPSKNEETYKVTPYESITTHYFDLETNISKNNINSRYGHENAPKCYTFLPLIRI